MDIAQLFESPLCMGIPEREREQFIEGFDYSVKSYMKGDVVFRQGDDPGTESACPGISFCRG